jgi:ATP-dependent RNA helicase RhlE
MGLRPIRGLVPQQYEGVFMEFTQLSIHPAILKALAQERYITPTPIQTKAIPPALSGRDLLGCAQTGTGKTAAFAVPILQRLHAHPSPAIGYRPIRSLILTPTRELAVQIYESFLAYGRYTGLRAAVVFGGVSQVPQEQSLRRGVDILVATPGRLNDLIGQGLVNLNRVEILTLDEADRMLDMGFIHDVKKILQRTPDQKQTLFFSATMPPEISELSASLLRDPVRVDVAPETKTVDLIAQSVYFVDKVNKRSLLLHLLKGNVIQSALVFTRTKHGADRVERELINGGINAQAIHGDKSQASRQQALNNFKTKSTRVLVATDIAARGIDIDDLSHVINFDMPDVPETYIHRIGRTGRAGHTGIAISFCDIEEKSQLHDIERLINRKVPIVQDHPYPMQVLTPPPKVPRPPRRIEEKARMRARFTRS